MEYDLLASESSSNMSGLLGVLLGIENDVEIICRSTDFVARHVIAPAVESTIHAYFKNCTPESEHIISDFWSLCTAEHDFNCDDIYAYSSQCKARRESMHCGGYTTDPSPVDRFMDDGIAGKLLLVGLVFIGILIGVASTITVCLVLPQTHRWADSKLRSPVSSAKEARASVVSDYYTAIDDRHNNADVKLRPINTTMSDSSTASSMRPLHPRSPHGFEYPTYLDSDAHPTARGPSSHCFQDTPEAPEESPYVETYEHLSRDDSHNQSHKYARVEPVSPTPSSPGTEHSYFVLEKNTA